MGARALMEETLIRGGLRRSPLAAAVGPRLNLGLAWGHAPSKPKHVTCVSSCFGARTYASWAVLVSIILLGSPMQFVLTWLGVLQYSYSSTRVRWVSGFQDQST